MIKGMSHIGVCVTDLARSKAFYCDGLGFEFEAGIKLIDTCGNVMGLEHFELHTCYVSLDGYRVELLHYLYSDGAMAATELRKMNHTGLTHMSISVDDIDAVAQRIVEFGGKVFPETRAKLESPEGTIELMYCADPDFTRVELIRYPS
jgi:glyoxylase I family protein